ncbi:MAG: T9SS C-terminal target domain-containing protein, partial [Calditrichaeota bacterium]
EKLAFVGWYNGIGNMKPGEGYYIYVSASASFDQTCPDQMAKAAMFVEAQKPKHFMHNEGNPFMPMNFYVTQASVDGVALQIGDEVAVYDGDRMVGSAVIERDINSHQPLSIVAAMDDGSGNGFTEGNTVRFRVWKQTMNEEIEIALDGITFKESETGSASVSKGFEPRATAMVNINAVSTVSVVPQAFELQQNYPNPFNPSTTITYAVPQDAYVKVQIYDITGKLVTTLVDDQQTAGYHSVIWKGVDASGLRVATGIYFYKMTAGKFVEVRKMLFAK